MRNIEKPSILPKFINNQTKINLDNHFTFELKNQVGISGNNSMKIDLLKYNMKEKVKILNNQNLSKEYNYVMRNITEENNNSYIKKDFEEKRNHIRTKQINTQNTVKILQKLLDCRDNSCQNQLKNKSLKKPNSSCKNLIKSKFNNSKILTSFSRKHSISPFKENYLDHSLSPVLAINNVNHIKKTNEKRIRDIRNKNICLNSNKSIALIKLQNRTYSEEFKSTNSPLLSNNYLKNDFTNDDFFINKDRGLKKYKSRKELIKDEKKKIEVQSKSHSSKKILKNSLQNNNPLGIYNDYLNNAMIESKEISPSGSNLSTSNLPEENNIEISSVLKLNDNEEMKINSCFNIVNHNIENYKGFISVSSPKANNTKEYINKKTSNNIEVESIEDMHLIYIKFFQQSKRILSLQEKEKRLIDINCKDSSNTTVIYLEEEKDIE